MFVSIIIPYFNDSNNIEYSVKSVLRQSFKKWELIIVDDENSKFSRNILKKIKKKNKKIKIFCTIKNKGVAAARNLGISKARGTYIAFLDSDDVWMKHKLKYQCEIIIKKGIDICYTNYIAFNEKYFLYKVNPPKILNYSSLLKSCPICCSTVLIKKKILKKNKFKNIKTKEDYELWLRLSKKNYVFFGINKYLTKYRVRPNSLSNKHFNKIFNAFIIFKKFNHLNLLLSIIYTARLYTNAFIKKYI